MASNEEISIDFTEAQDATDLLGRFMAVHERKGFLLQQRLLDLSINGMAFRAAYERGVVFTDLTDEALALFVSAGAVDVPKIPNA